MKIEKWLVQGLTSLLLCFVLTGSVMSQDIVTVANSDQNDPETVLASYFSAINQQNYSLAYSYWDQQSEVQKMVSLEQFIQGYADTGSVEAYFRLPANVGVALGTTWGKVPTILGVMHSDGTRHYYTGCYMTRKSAVPVGNPPTQDWNFYINEGSMIEVADASAAFDQLGHACVHVWQFCSGDIDCTKPIQ